jgi:hypothetical protein
MIRFTKEGKYIGDLMMEANKAGKTRTNELKLLGM